jgi:hypothetical protein
MPTGGPVDSLPPVLLKTEPELAALNYDEEDVRFTFNEYILISDISETLVISPPLEKRPIIRTKSKTLVIQFNEDLKDSTTYSLDFKNSIVDNNEKNSLDNFRFSFSTGPEYDSLRVAGRMMDAFSLEPIENGLVLLHNNLHDSAIYSVRPNYIARTDENGLFMIDNIAEGRYHIFGVNDLNGDLVYNEGAEEIAFADTLVIPGAEFHPEQDTLTKGVDSMLITGHIHFSPDPFFLRSFMEDIYEQYLDSYKRESRLKCIFKFNESVRDSFGIKLLNVQAEDWYLMETNQKMDSLVMWVSDTTVAANDSLIMELSYLQLDSAGQPYLHNDTLLLMYADKAKPEKKRRRGKDDEEEEEVVIPQFNWQNNIKSTMEANSTIKLNAPEPLATIDTTKIRLFISSDTLKTPLPVRIVKDTVLYRTYNISYPWMFEENYTLEIDSAAAFNIYGISSKAYSRKFEIREEDYYGAVTFEFSNVNMPVIVQLLKNDENESVLRQQTIEEEGNVLFEYLAPDKYKIKFIYDRNGNGKWDTGSFQDNFQPEMVQYLPEVIKIRSNWRITEPWDLTPDVTFYKNIRDKEKEEQERKAAEKRAREERQQQQNNSMFRPGESGSGGSMQLNRQ